MFDFGFGELLLLGVIGLVVLGPERLPVAARLLGRWIRGARSQWNAVKAELENEIADEELRRNLREASAALRQGAQSLHAAHERLADAGGQMVSQASGVMGESASPPLPASPRERGDGQSTEVIEGVEDSASIPSRVMATAPTAASTATASDPAQLSLLDPEPSQAVNPRSRADG
ncbi:MAG: twin-arginine translocase subunit TatB [Proteobacteria bacterium]|nr:twin-arginine translocase subunit TatB [Pseudomonadota bacterium]